VNVSRLTRREFLAASCALPVAGACSNRSPTAPTSYPSTAAIVFQQDFDSAALGIYTAEALAAGWLGASPYNGVREGRVAVFEGPEARLGRSIRVTYPQGAVGAEPGGAQWKLRLGGSYNELFCSYAVRFAPPFDFVRGGKLPGLIGGAGNTGGHKPTGFDGWSARMMWQAGGEAIQYVYHVDQPTEYGEAFHWNLGGQRYFRPGTWHRVEHRIVINTPGVRDGIVQGWFDGALALDRRDVRFRNVNTFSIDGFYFSTFFGGDDPSWAPTKDERIDFDQFAISTGRV